MPHTGVLLINLGTPDSPRPEDVKKYLIEFLTDGRVIDIPWLKRQILVRRIIVPKRYKESAQNYSRIWTDRGSPLLSYGKMAAEKLQEALGPEHRVSLAMRYQSPSIEQGLNDLQTCRKLIILPLFPQYASATTGSVHQKVMELVSKWTTIPDIRFINSYPTHPLMIEAFCARGRECDISSYDHVLFSFHGLPEKQVKKADRHAHCLREENCCRELTDKNHQCYSAQCHQTAFAIADGLGLSPESYSIAFQSRLGKDPWLKPYTADVLHNLAKHHKKKVLVFSPAFVCDCLETIDEIGKEYKEEFIGQGGQQLDLVSGLNGHPLWIEALKEMVIQDGPRTSDALSGKPVPECQAPQKDALHAAQAPSFSCSSID